jgi:hypothetical protein
VLHLEVVRACACLDLRRFDAAREHLRHVLSRPLREADFLTFAGFVQLFVRLWPRAATLPLKDPLRDRLDALLLASGLMPDAFFEGRRQRGRKAEVNFYRCLARQPLGDDWPGSPGCLPGQESWTEYFAEWGVLAQDEEHAAELVLAWQARCHPLPAQVEHVEIGSEGYFDKPGVVWQGPRWIGEE